MCGKTGESLMKILKKTHITVGYIAALGFACILIISATVPAANAEDMPAFDNQGSKVYKALEKTPGTNLAAESRGRNLVEFYKLRQYPGSPPRIPHEVDQAFSGKETDCLSCHERGGYSPEYGEFAPVTPHPENSLCYQCHVQVTTEELFVESEWASIKTPLLGRSALPGSPPPIPHSLQLRENCVACHTGPGAVVEIQVSHASRGDCRQCHAVVIQTEPLKEFSRK
jgi:nitrate reductase (cytochrome), electron transfer subunit